MTKMQATASQQRLEKSTGLRVLVNARPLQTVFTGVARYTRSLYSTIDALELARVKYFSNGMVSDQMPAQSRNVAIRYFPRGLKQLVRTIAVKFMGNRLSRIFDTGAVDVYHETSMFPLAGHKDVPNVITIYDLSLITHPECHPCDRVRHFERYFFERLEHVDHIITISEFIKEQIIRNLGINRRRVSAIPLASSNVFFKRVQSDVKQYLCSKRLPCKYILCVGTLEPRKNHVTLIRALSLSKTDLPLICVGWSGWMSESIEKEIRKYGLRGRVINMGHVPDEELAMLYSGAKLLVYPSLYEGFGLPIVEAMACGCPVICSDISSMPEVAGNAATLVDPRDEVQIARSIDDLVFDEGCRQRWIRKGHERVKQFSWEGAALGTMDVFAAVSRA